MSLYKVFRCQFVLRAFLILFAIYLSSCYLTVEDRMDTPPPMPAPAPGIVRDMPIMGRGKANAAQLGKYFLKYNPQVNRTYLKTLINVYLKECAIEGVNSDVAFIQMVHETNFLRFGNQVKPEQNNFAGIGATDDGAKGASFKTIEEGVRAQVHHLKAYASFEPLKQKNASPRFHFVKRGSAVYVSELGNGKWATDPDYARKLLAKINELYLINSIK